MKAEAFIFFGLSALTHLAVIGGGNYDAQLSGWINQPGQGRSALDIQLQKPAPRTASTDAQPVSKSHQSSDNLTVVDSKLPSTTTAVKQIASIRPVAQTTESGKNNPPATESEFVATNQPVTHKGHAADTVKVASILNHQLSQYFYYPRSAQRKNWQGRVILEFAISAQGNIEHVQIQQSSGYRSLDEAAVSALNKIEAREELSKALFGQSIRQTLPVTYRLH